METSPLIQNTQLLARRLLVALLLGLGACQSAPPPGRFQGPVGLVRAELDSQAQEVSLLFEDLCLKVEQLLPDVENQAREVWVQEKPTLYRFEGNSYAEADGFWVASSDRIHLRADAQSLRRTLAHELVHAALGTSWNTLPGTLEEGLCDVVSVRLCPEDAADMRTGRLSAAAFATGGLELEVQLFSPTTLSQEDLRVGSMTRVRLVANAPSTLNPRDVFSVEAGLSTTRMPLDDKKALYGLGYLLVDRIVERRGFNGLHQLCLRAERQGLPKVPAAWLLEAADMRDATHLDWRLALQEAIGEEELKTLVEIYPSLLSDSTTRFLGRPTMAAVSKSGLGQLLASVRVRGAKTMLDLRLDVETPLGMTLEGHFKKETSLRE